MKESMKVWLDQWKDENMVKYLNKWKNEIIIEQKLINDEYRNYNQLNIWVSEIIIEKTF